MDKKIGEFLISLARGAGEILLKRFRRVRHIERKLNAGIVTEADKMAESYLLKKIFRNYPNSSIITEESGKFEGRGPLCWVIDPLDGTSNYAHGFPWYCVSIGVHEEGVSKWGVVFHPSMEELFFAQRDHGSWLNGKRMKVSVISRLEDSLLGTGFYYAKGEALERDMEIFRRINDRALGVRRPGAAALDLAYLACGRYDGFWERGLAPWDVAAGYLLVEEAGGRTTNYRGKPTTINDGEVVATNGKLHRAIIELIQD